MSTLTYEDLRSALQAAIVAALPEDDENDNWVYVYDFSDSFVIYYSQGEYLQDDYTVDDDGNVSLAGSPAVVRPVTTYEPVSEGKSAGPLERRGAFPPELRAALERTAPSVEVRAEPVTYRPSGEHSYFRDLALTDRVPGAAERLDRHRREMEVILAAREHRAFQALRAGEIEYRVEPNRTDGQGGFFTVPLWVNELFAMAKRPGRVLSGLIPNTFALPAGVSSINVPIITQGTVVQPVADTQAVPDQAITDAAGSSAVATLSGQEDVPLQMLEQSPLGAALDWVVFSDLTEAYDYDLETQLVVGTGVANTQLLGLANVVGNVKITYTDTTPTGSEMYPYFGEAAGQLADGRRLPPQCWLMRTARWTWLATQEDTAQRPFGLPSPFFLGNTDDTPDPMTGIIGWPVFGDDAIPATLGATGNQDIVVGLRPSDLILLEGTPKTAVFREVLSGTLSARIQLHNSVAAITNRYPSGIAVLGGTGFAVQSGY